MELKVIECSQYVLNERINEFEQDHKIKHITYLFKEPHNILSVIEYTTTKEHKKQLAKEEKKEKIEEQQKEATQYLR